MLKAERQAHRPNVFEITSGMGVARDANGDLFHTYNFVFGIFDLSNLHETAEIFARPTIGDQSKVFGYSQRTSQVRISEAHVLQAFDSPVELSRLSITEKPDPIPEPSTLLLFGTGMLGLLAWARRKKKLAAI